MDEIVGIPINEDMQYLHIKLTSDGNPVFLFIHGNLGTCGRTRAMPT
ncbi:MAG: hypothetical protein IKE18_06620 [Oscillospiraceae bacterium]|nr:hypothetical protein [Oscillospiraceae bacterium]